MRDVREGITFEAYEEAGRPSMAGSYEILSAFGLSEIYHGEFDPGSERTLAARLKHASRAARVAIPLERRTGE